MRDLGSPVHSRGFFRAMLAALPGTARILLVRDKGGRTVGAAVCLFFRDTIMVPWVSSLREAFALCPNFVLYWEVIRYGCRTGYRVLDLGRSFRSAGTFEFKRQWGAHAASAAVDLPRHPAGRGAPGGPRRQPLRRAGPRAGSGCRCRSPTRSARGSAVRCRTERSCVSIAILNYQRRDALRRALEAARAPALPRRDPRGRQRLHRRQRRDGARRVSRRPPGAAAREHRGRRAQRRRGRRQGRHRVHARQRRAVHHARRRSRGAGRVRASSPRGRGQLHDRRSGRPALAAATGAIRAIPIAGASASSSPITCWKAPRRAGARRSSPPAATGPRCSSATRAGTSGSASSRPATISSTRPSVRVRHSSTRASAPRAGSTTLHAQRGVGRAAQFPRRRRRRFHRPRPGLMGFASARAGELGAYRRGAGRCAPGRARRAGDSTRLSRARPAGSAHEIRRSSRATGPSAASPAGTADLGERAAGRRAQERASAGSSPCRRSSTARTTGATRPAPGQEPGCAGEGEAPEKTRNARARVRGPA